MRRHLFLLLVAAPAVAAAQAGVRVAPQMVSYTLGAPSSMTISETALPVFAYVTVSPTLTIDVGTAFATANVKGTAGGQARESRISGPTDTQIRAVMNLGSDRVLVTAGLNVPTGKSTADTSEQLAATLIGNDFLVFPISSLGSGFGGTGGVAFASPMGQWNVGAGLSLRTGMPFDPYEDANGARLRYTPGTEMRARIGIDHPYGTGSAALGITYSRFSDDKFQGSIYNTGDRLLTQASVSNSIWSGDYLLSAWNLFRSSGTLADGTVTGTESITDLSAAYGMRMGAGRVEPGVNVRLWTQQEVATSIQTSVGLRYEMPLGRMTVSPGVGFSFGKMGASATEASSLSGYRAQLTIRMQ